MKFRGGLAAAALVLFGGSVGPAAAAGTPDIAGTWKGALTRNGRPWTVRFGSWHTPDGLRVCFDFPDYGLYYRCTSDVSVTEGLTLIRYTSGRDVVTLEGTLDSSRYVGHWKGLGVDADFQLERSGPAGAPLAEEDVRFRNGDVELAGTLVRPAAPGRYAAVVWTHGSGDQSRATDFYRDRAYLLAENGLAAFIYDKRGVGKSGGDRESTLDELAGDAVAAVQCLQGRADIDSNAVGVGGFSQGGFVAPLAAARYGRIAFVVTGATPGVTPAELNDFAARTALVRRGFSADVIERAMSLRREVLHAQETGEELPKLERTLSAARSEPWFDAADLPRSPVQPYGSRGLSVLHFDPVPVWERVAVPVLAVWGADDALVPVERSRRAVEAGLRVARNPNVTTRVFPNAGHGLAETGRAGVWDWPRLAPGFHDFMMQWVLARLPARGAAMSSARGASGS